MARDWHYHKEGRNDDPYTRVQQGPQYSSKLLAEPTVRCPPLGLAGLMVGPSGDLAMNTSSDGGFPHCEIGTLSRQRSNFKEVLGDMGTGGLMG